MRIEDGISTITITIIYRQGWRCCWAPSMPGWHSQTHPVLLCMPSPIPLVSWNHHDIMTNNHPNMKIMINSEYNHSKIMITMHQDLTSMYLMVFQTASCCPMFSGCFNHHHHRRRCRHLCLHQYNHDDHQVHWGRAFSSCSLQRAHTHHLP